MVGKKKTKEKSEESLKNRDLQIFMCSGLRVTLDTVVNMRGGKSFSSNTHAQHHTAITRTPRTLPPSLSPLAYHPAPSTPQPWHLYRDAVVIRRQSPTEAAPYSANYVPVGCQGEYPIRSVTQQVGSDARRGEGRHRRFLVRRGSAFTKCIHVKRGGFWNTAIQREQNYFERGGAFVVCVCGALLSCTDCNLAGVLCVFGVHGNRGKGGRESGLTRGGRDRRRRSALRHFGGWQGRGGWDERPLQKKDRVPKKKKRRELLMFDRASLLLFCLVFFIACNSVCRLDSETHLHSARQGTESIRGRDERESKEGGEARKGENRAKSVNLPFSFLHHPFGERGGGGRMLSEITVFWDSADGVPCILGVLITVFGVEPAASPSFCAKLVTT